jgi:hypothetical protein
MARTLPDRSGIQTRRRPRGAGRPGAAMVAILITVLMFAAVVMTALTGGAGAWSVRSREIVRQAGARPICLPARCIVWLRERAGETFCPEGG